MCAEVKRSSNYSTPDVGNLEEVEEIESATLVNSDELREVGSIEELKELSTIGTQTPLTLIKLTVTQSPLDRQFIDSTTSPTRFSYETTCDFKDTPEIVKSFSRAFLRSKTSITLRREAMTQAAPPHPSLLQSMPTTSRDTLQISTSLSSCKSGPRNEVLTVTTDYGTPSPDGRSMLVDSIDESGNRDVHIPVQNTYELSQTPESASPNDREATRNDLSTLETSRQRWSLTDCIHCASGVDDEPDTRPYMRDAPPSYSAIFPRHVTATRNWIPFRSTNESSFIAPIPPPSYAQAEGICLASMDQLFSLSHNTSRLWTASPMTALCPRCTTIIITAVEVRQSIITHIAAFALFLCGCWPCCMFPYCMNTCKTIDHYCPVCRAHLGTYRPC